jgi:hypothetical protein
VCVTDVGCLFYLTYLPTGVSLLMSGKLCVMHMMSAR